MANLNLFALGGQDENGKNSFVLEVENDIFIINSGIKVPINNRYGIDGIISEYKYIVERKDRVKGLFLTHAHDETFAALPWILMEFPDLKVYGSQFTIGVAKDRVSKYKYKQKPNDRNFIVIDGNEPIKFGSVTVRCYPVANSILGSFAYSFATPDGEVLFMSNLVNANLGVFGSTDLKKIASENRNLLALCLDARIAGYTGSSRDHHSIVPFIEKNFERASRNSRIIIGAYDEEMFNLQEVMELAIKYKRQVSSYGRNFDFLYRELKLDTNVPSPEFIDYQKSNSVDDAVVLVTGSWSRLYQRFVRIAENNDVYLKLRPSDLVIMMAPPINGMEVEYSETLDAIARTAPNIIDVTENDLYQLRPARDDIREIVQTLKPRYFVPISALYRYLVVAGKIASDSGVNRENCLNLQNGRIAHFIGGKLASQKARVKEYGDVLIDGFGVGDISFEVVKERQALASGGLISLAFAFDKSKKEVVGDISLQIIGVVVKSQVGKVTEQIKKIILQKIQEMETYNYKEFQNSIRKKIQKTMSKVINKEPLTIITINEV